MGFGQVFIDFHGSHRRLFCLGQNLAWREVHIRQPEISISQTAISQRIIRVNSDCLLENLDCFEHPVFTVFVPEIPAPQIKVVGFRVMCRLFSEADFIVTG